jgi:threonylcarbamoyladenosine tRNA methylthiotransferase MtaB
MAERLPRFGLGADVMVGFPGETDSDFDATRVVIERLPFTYLHVFPYSERPTASARNLGAPVDPGVVRERSAVLREIADAKGASYRRRRAGCTADIVTLTRRAGWYQGLTEDYLTVQWRTARLAPERFAGRLTLESDGSLGVASEVVG